MDTWLTMAFALILALLKDKKAVTKYFAVLAKIYVQIHLAAQMDQRLQAEIEHQELKVGGR